MPVFKRTYKVPASCNILHTNPFPARYWTGRSQTVGRKGIDPPPLVQTAAMHLGCLFGCYDDTHQLKLREKWGKSSGRWGVYGSKDTHERIDPVLGHPSFLFIFRNRNEGAANYHTTNVEEDGLEIGVRRHPYRLRGTCCPRWYLRS
jgi:hypothetical protein